MGHLCHTPFPKGSGLSAEERAERLWEQEGVDFCSKTTFVKQDSTVAHMNSQGWNDKQMTCIRPSQGNSQHGRVQGWWSPTLRCEKWVGQRNNWNEEIGGVDWIKTLYEF